MPDMMVSKVAFMAFLAFVFSSTYYVFFGPQSAEVQVALIHTLGLDNPVLQSYLPSRSSVYAVLFPFPSISSPSALAHKIWELAECVVIYAYHHWDLVLYFGICFVFTRALYGFMFDIGDIQRPLEATVDLDIHGKQHPNGELRTRKEPGDVRLSLCYNISKIKSKIILAED